MGAGDGVKLLLGGEARFAPSEPPPSPLSPRSPSPRSRRASPRGPTARSAQSFIDATEEFGTEFCEAQQTKMQAALEEAREFHPERQTRARARDARVCGCRAGAKGSGHGGRATSCAQKGPCAWPARALPCAESQFRPAGALRALRDVDQPRGELEPGIRSPYVGRASQCAHLRPLSSKRRSLKGRVNSPIKRRPSAGIAAADGKAAASAVLCPLSVHFVACS